METTAEELQIAVERMHHCRAQLSEVVPVCETFSSTFALLSLPLE